MRNVRGGLGCLGELALGLFPIVSIVGYVATGGRDGWVADVFDVVLGIMVVPMALFALVLLGGVLLGKGSGGADRAVESPGSSGMDLGGGGDCGGL